MSILTPRFFGNRKTPKVPIGTSGVSDPRNAKISTLRFNQSYTFTGLTPGVRVSLLDTLFVEETNNIFRANIVRTGTVNEYGQITFDGLRDSIYSLIVVNIDNAGESIYNVPIGDPKRFDTVAQHTIPSQPQIYSVSVEDLGLTAQATVLWRQGADGVKGFPELFYSLSGASSWTLFNRWEDENVYSAVVGPLEFDSIYKIRVHLLNEDMLPGPWSNIVYATTPATPVVAASGEIGYTEEICFLKFDDATFKDYSSKNVTFSGYNPSDISDTDPIYGKASYYSNTGVTTIYSSNSEFNLRTSPPYVSFSFEGTFAISDTVTVGDKLGLFGSNGHFGASARCVNNADYLDKLSVKYGQAEVEFDLPPSKPGYAWEQGKAKHLLINFDASNDSYWSCTAYLDGFLVGTENSTYYITAPTAPLNLFCWDGQDAYKYKGRADNIRFVKTVGGIPSQDLTPPHIKSTVPAKGVFDTGNTFPRLRIDSHDDPESKGTSPTLDFYGSNEQPFFHVSQASGFVLNTGVVDGYYLKTNAQGKAYWAPVSGGSDGVYSTTLNPSLAMPEDVGGIAAGTLVSDLLGDSFITMFDNLLFPTVLASIGANRTLTTSTTLPVTSFEVGTSLAPGLTATFSSGLIQNGDGTNGPGLVGHCSGMLFRNPLDATISYEVPALAAGLWVKSLTVPAYVIAAGANTWDVIGYYAVGSGNYYDNKGDVGRNLDANRAAGNTTTNFTTANGYYRYWYDTGTYGSHPTNSTGVRSLTHGGFLSSSNIGTFNISISAGTQEVYFYTYSGKTATITYTESSNADVTGSFTKIGIVVNDAGGTARNYEGYYSYIGAGGYPSTATYRVVIT